MNADYIMPYEHAEQSLRYWRDLSDCNCDSEFPTGGCEKCDMQGVLNLLQHMHSVMNKAATCLRSLGCEPSVEMRKLLGEDSTESNKV